MAMEGDRMLAVICGALAWILGVSLGVWLVIRSNPRDDRP